MSHKKLVMVLIFLLLHLTTQCDKIRNSLLQKITHNIVYKLKKLHLAQNNTGQ